MHKLNVNYRNAFNYLKPEWGNRVATPSIESIAREITTKLGGILAVRIYLGVADSLGNIIYADSELEQFHSFVSTFVNNNFKYLKVGDHSLPISGKNIMFFRLRKAMLIMYSIKGRVGQLLTFKSLLPKYMDSFDSFVPDVQAEAFQPPVVGSAQAVTEAAPTVPVSKVVFSRREAFYKEIYPKLNKKIKEGAKFSLAVSVILNYSDGVNSILDLFDKLEIEQHVFFSESYKLYKANWIKIPDYEFFQIGCPNCKSENYQLIPSEFLKTSPNGYIRFQISCGNCDHASYVTIDKKKKIKSKIIPKLKDIEDEIDFSELSIEKLIQFLGQDNFFNLFHATFFKNKVLFLESNHYAEKISDFMKNFFPQVSYQEEIQSISRNDYLKLSKKFADFLVIDLNSNIVVNEPYEPEELDFELRLFREILKEADQKVQILKTHAEFERLILNIDSILNEIELFKEIKEDELIDLMQKNHNIVLERSDIPVIKELADIYYGVDVRKKITKTLVGQVSDWLEGI